MNLSLPTLNFIVKVAITMAIIGLALKFLPANISGTAKSFMYA